jgi:hypothetical protein
MSLNCIPNRHRALLARHDDVVSCFPLAISPHGEPISGRLLGSNEAGLKIQCDPKKVRGATRDLAQYVSFNSKLAALSLLEVKAMTQQSEDRSALEPHLAPYDTKINNLTEIFRLVNAKTATAS